MYRIKHKPTGQYARSAGYTYFETGKQYHLAKLSSPGKVFEREINLDNTPEFEKVRCAVLDEIVVEVRLWNNEGRSLMWKAGIDEQTYFNGYEVIDKLRKVGLNIMLVTIGEQLVLFVDTRTFGQR